MVEDSLLFIYQNIVHGLISVLIFVFAFFLFKYLLTHLFNHFDKNPNNDLKVTKFSKYLEQHPFITSFIIITICWLPYFICFYPGILSPDPTFQIKQFFGIPNKYSNYVVLLDQNQIITNHHPVIHTLLLGSCLKLGHLINNDNLGLFFYIIIQSSVFISTLSYTIYYLKKIGLKTKYLLITLLIYALVPVFPMYTMACVKDVFFGCYIIIFITLLYDLLKEKLSIKKLLFLLLILVLITISRNNGIYVIILSLLPILFIKIDCKKRVIAIFVTAILLYYGYDKVILPSFKVTNTSVREALSIPFQQTARVAKEHEEILTKNDIKAIDQILNYDTLKVRYNSELSDPVKNGYNRYATKKDLIIYFKSWFKTFFKAPVTYIEATISNTYGYYYPLKTNWYIYYKEVSRINEDGFNYHYNNLTIPRKGLTLFAQGFPYLPVVGMLVNIGLNVWALLIMGVYLLINKKIKYCIYLIPSFVLFLVCLASPANCYFRYALPFVFALPLNYGIFKTVNNLKIKKGVKK